MCPTIAPGLPCCPLLEFSPIIYIPAHTRRISNVVISRAVYWMVIYYRTGCDCKQRYFATVLECGYIPVVIHAGPTTQPADCGYTRWTITTLYNVTMEVSDYPGILFFFYFFRGIFTGTLWVKDLAAQLYLEARLGRSKFTRHWGLGWACGEIFLDQCL